MQTRCRLRAMLRLTLVLTLMASMGCATWKPYRDDPTGMHAKTLRLTLSDSTVCRLERARVRDGVVSGFRDGRERQVPLDRVARVEERTIDNAETILLATTGMLAFTAGLFYGWLLVPKGDPRPVSW